MGLGVEQHVDILPQQTDQVPELFQHHQFIFTGCEDDGRQLEGDVLERIRYYGDQGQAVVFGDDG